MKYTKKVPYFKKGDKFDKALRKLPKGQKEAILKISSTQKEQERKDKLSSVGDGFKKPTAKVTAPADTRSKQIKSTVGKKVAKTFDQAFQQARKRGDSEFLWKGKRYHTRTAEEEAESKTSKDKTSKDKTSKDKTSKDKTSKDKTSKDKTSAEVEQFTSPWLTRPVIDWYGNIVQGPEASIMATPTRSQDIKKSSVGSVTPIEGNRTEVPTEPIAMSSAEFTPPWITNPITRLVRDKYGNWITRPASDRYGHIIQGADSTWSFQQGGQMPQGADKEQGGTINKFQRGNVLTNREQHLVDVSRLPKLSIPQVWGRKLFGTGPKPVETGRTFLNRAGEQAPELGNRFIMPGGRDVTTVTRPTNYGSGWLTSQRNIQGGDTTYVTPGRNAPSAADLPRYKSVFDNADKAIWKSRGYQQGGQVEQQPQMTEEDLVIDFTVRYFSALGVAPEDIMDQEGSLNPAYVEEITNVFQQGDIDWESYMASPDEYIQQFVGSRMQMARKGAKLKRLSQIRMHFRGGPTPYVSDFKRAVDKKIAWSEKYGQDDLSGVERRDSQMSKPMPESIRAKPTPYVSDFKRAVDKKIAWSEKYGQDDLSGVERRDSQMSKPMPESIRAKQELLSNSRRGPLRNTTINPKFNNPRFNFNKYLLKR